MRTSILVLLCCLQFINHCAQGQESKIYKPNIILFRLNESTTQIEAHMRRGDNDKAAKVKRMDKATHLSIINDFKRYFTFCPVYFFYEKDLVSVLKKNWDDVIFTDTSFGNTDKRIKFDNSGNFFIAEINYPPSITYDTVRTIDPSRLSSQLGSDDGAVASHDYCILLYDDQYRLLPKPFRMTNIAYRKYGLIFGSEEKGYKFLGAEALNNKLKKHLKD